MHRPEFNIEERDWKVSSIQKTVNALGTSLDLICSPVELETPADKVKVGDKIKIGKQDLQLVSMNIIFKGEALSAQSLGLLVLPPGHFLFATCIRPN